MHAEKGVGGIHTVMEAGKSKMYGKAARLETQGRVC